MIHQSARQLHDVGRTAATVYLVFDLRNDDTAGSANSCCNCDVGGQQRFVLKRQVAVIICTGCTQQANMDWAGWVEQVVFALEFDLLDQTVLRALGELATTYVRINKGTDAGFGQVARAAARNFAEPMHGGAHGPAEALDLIVLDHLHQFWAFTGFRVNRVEHGACHDTAQ